MAAVRQAQSSCVLVLMSAVNHRHCRGLKARTGPSGFLESRTAHTPVCASRRAARAATWTHWPPFPPLWLLVRHAALFRSTFGRLGFPGVVLKLLSEWPSA